MNLHKTHLALVVAMGIAASGSAFAKKPESAGQGGKHAAHEAGQAHQHGGATAKSHEDYFNSDRADRIRRYYAERNGGQAPTKCPPGLAKKNNGCLPPGQAKKWNRGQPLPSDVRYERVSDSLLREFGRTPQGQEVLRVGSDILLIDEASRVVIDAIENIGGLF